MNVFEFYDIFRLSFPINSYLTLAAIVDPTA